MSTQNREQLEAQIEKCLKTVQSALGIRNQPNDFESSGLKGKPGKGAVATDSGNSSDKRKNNDLDAMRTAAKQRHAKAKALFAKNQMRFAESQVKFVRYASALYGTEKPD